MTSLQRYWRLGALGGGLVLKHRQLSIVASSFAKTARTCFQDGSKPKPKSPSIQSKMSIAQREGVYRLSNHAFVLVRAHVSCWRFT